MNVRMAPEITGKFRAGDIRRCFADITKSREKLGFHPNVHFRAGMEELAGWLSQQIVVDKVEDATSELVSKGLVA